MYAVILLIISLHVHWLSIHLLIEFGSKTNERNTTKNNIVWYLCFIVVDFIHSCHHRLKWVALFEEKEISVNRSDLLAINATTAFTILKSLEYKFLRRFLVQGWQQSFWKFSVLSNILDLEWCLSNKWKLHSATVHHVTEMAKIASLVTKL